MDRHLAVEDGYCRDHIDRARALVTRQTRAEAEVDEEKMLQREIEESKEKNERKAEAKTEAKTEVIVGVVANSISSATLTPTSYTPLSSPAVSFREGSVPTSVELSLKKSQQENANLMKMMLEQQSEIVRLKQQLEEAQSSIQDQVRSAICRAEQQAAEQRRRAVQNILEQGEIEKQQAVSNSIEEYNRRTKALRRQRLYHERLQDPQVVQAVREKVVNFYLLCHSHY